MRIVLNINGDKAEVEHVTDKEQFIAFRYNDVARVICPVGVKVGATGELLVMGRELCRGTHTNSPAEAKIKTYRASQMEACVERSQ